MCAIVDMEVGVQALLPGEHFATVWEVADESLLVGIVLIAIGSIV